MMIPVRSASKERLVASTVACETVASVVPPMVVTLTAPARPVALVPGLLDIAAAPARATTMDELLAVRSIASVDLMVPCVRINDMALSSRPAGVLKSPYPFRATAPEIPIPLPPELAVEEVVVLELEV